jgi:hypothetical protein
VSFRQRQRRGQRVAPPAAAGDWELRFATGEAADGWEELCANAPGPTKACWEQLRREPRRHDQPQKQLRDNLAQRTIGGQTYEQWQYEVTGGGRVWYCPDGERRTVWPLPAVNAKSGNNAPPIRLIPRSSLLRYSPSLAGRQWWPGHLRDRWRRWRGQSARGFIWPPSGASGPCLPTGSGAR